MSKTTIATTVLAVLFGFSLGSGTDRPAPPAPAPVEQPAPGEPPQPAPPGELPQPAPPGELPQPAPIWFTPIGMCPTEDSCRIDYRGGSWYVRQTTP